MVSLLMDKSIIQYIEKRRRDYDNPTWATLADEINRQFQTLYNKESLRSWYRRQNTITPLPKPFNDILEIPHITTLVVSDFHSPFHNPAMLDLAIKAAAHHSVKQIIVAGDLFDFNVISSHPKNDATTRIQSDLYIGGEVLLALAEYAPVYVTNGNHDERVAKKLDTNLPLASVIHMALAGKTPRHKVTVTEYDYLYIGKSYIAGHLSNYSKEPGKIAVELAIKYNRHVLVGHDHIRGVKLSDNGLLFGISIGGMLMKDRFWYKERRLTVLPEFENGFAVVHETGEISVYDDSGRYTTYAIS